MAQVGFWRGVVVGALLSLVGVVILTVGFVVYGQYQIGKRAEERREQQVSRSGLTLHPPDFSRSDSGNSAEYSWTLRDMDDELVAFEDFRGRVVVLTFWATWCLPCDAEIPTIDALMTRMGDRPSLAFALVSDEDLDVVNKHAEKNALDVPLYAAEGGIPGVFFAETRPTAFILSCDGKIVYKHVGAADWNDESVVEFLEGHLRECS